MTTSPVRANQTLRRALSQWGATAFVVTNMVGTGIFTVPAFVRASTGNGLASLGVWAAGAFLALCGALCYAELATRMPEAGGEYYYLSRIYGRLWGFLSGWISFFVGFSAAIAAAALGAVAYAATLFPQWNSTKPLIEGIGITQGSALAALLIILLSVFHSSGVRPSGRLQTGIALLVVLAILVLILAGISTGKGDWSRITQGQHVSQLWWVALLQVNFAYSGWNAAAYLAGETVNPRKTLPRALIGGTLIVAVLYLLLNLLFLYAVPIDEWGPKIAVGHLASRHLRGGWGARSQRHHRTHDHWISQFDDRRRSACLLGHGPGRDGTLSLRSLELQIWSTCEGACRAGSDICSACPHGEIRNAAHICGFCPAVIRGVRSRECLLDSARSAIVHLAFPHSRLSSDTGNLSVAGCCSLDRRTAREPERYRRGPRHHRTWVDHLLRRFEVRMDSARSHAAISLG